jgi:hypothetical protein
LLFVLTSLALGPPGATLEERMRDVLMASRALVLALVSCLGQSVSQSVN